MTGSRSPCRPSIAVRRFRPRLGVTAPDLLDEGRFPHEFFVILDGTVHVVHDGEQVASLGQGDFLGEIAIIEGLRRTATVVAATPVRAAVMHERDFREMCEELPVVDHIRRGVGALAAVQLAVGDDETLPGRAAVATGRG